LEIEGIKSKHLLKALPFNWTALERGYTDKVLYINLHDNQIFEKIVPLIVKGEIYWWLRLRPSLFVGCHQASHQMERS
jgi:hypothetical protein